MQWLILLLILSGCRELTQREPLLPPLGKKDLKNIISPANNTYANSSVENSEDEVEPQPTNAMLQPVSINVCESLPLKHFIVELARQAKVDLQLDPKIDQHIVFSANNTPLIKVIEEMCELAHLRTKLLVTLSELKKTPLILKIIMCSF